MRVLAIIPARGGSKGIPRKNITVVGGKPLLVHTIQHAFEAASITRVVVSTDCPEIAAVAEAAAAEVVLRPADLSGDSAPSEAALKHVVETLRERDGWVPDLIVFLQATSPFRPAGSVEAAIQQLLASNSDSLFSAVPLHGFVWRDANGSVQPLTYDYRNRKMRQAVGEDLVENGSIYVFRTWVLDQLNNRLGGRISVFRMDPLCLFQIDEPADLPLFETILTTERAGAAAPKWSEIRLLALDFDGVLTDNRVSVSASGEETVLCSRADGMGIARLREAGIEVLVISRERSAVVEARCRKLQVPCFAGCMDKLPVFSEALRQRDLHPGQAAFVGNDIQDLECLTYAGTGIIVADSEPALFGRGFVVTTRKGGYGAVREVSELILASQPSHQSSAAMLVAAE